jgi:AcrR family transcriptional regulator
MPRAYSMAARSAAADATRDRILDAAAQLFFAGFYDDVTLQEVAAGAEVSAQTVINHFGGKAQLFLAACERMSDELRARRFAPAHGDVVALIEALVDDYDITGDAIMRMLALEGRVEALEPVLAMGRHGHREWVTEMFGRPDLADELVVATDVYAWKLLRRDRGLSRDDTVAAIRRIVESLLTYDP